MLLLDKSKNIKDYIQLKHGFAIPVDIASLCENRFDSFMYRTDPLKPLNYNTLQGIAEKVASTYGMPVSVGQIEFYTNMMRMFGWNLEIIKYSMMSVLNDDIEFPDFSLPEHTKTAVESNIINYAKFTESINLLKDAFQKLLNDIDYEFIKDNPTFDPVASLSEKELNNYKNLGTMLWLYHYVWGIVDTSEFEDRMLGKVDMGTEMILLRRGKDIAIFNYEQNNSWTFYEVEYRNEREKKKSTEYPYTNIDEMTFFDVVDDKFIMHDDLIPSMIMYDEKGKRYEVNDIEVDKNYYLEISYPVKDSTAINGYTVSFKPTLGCVFKDVEMELAGGKVTTQFKATSNLFKFKIANKEKKLPFKFFYNTKKISADNLPWM